MKNRAPDVLCEEEILSCLVKSLENDLFNKLTTKFNFCKFSPSKRSLFVGFFIEVNREKMLYIQISFNFSIYSTEIDIIHSFFLEHSSNSRLLVIKVPL